MNSRLYKVMRAEEVSAGEVADSGSPGAAHSSDSDSRSGDPLTAGMWLH